MIVRGSGTLSAAALTSYTSPIAGARLTVQSSGTFTANLLSNIDQLLITVNTGAELSLPAVTSYFSAAVNPTVFNVNGRTPGLVHSMLDLSNLSSITYNSGTAATRFLRIVAGVAGTAGGQIDLSGLHPRGRPLS